MTTIRLETSVRFLRGVGERRADLLGRLGISTVRDLLYHIPFRYLDATTVTPIAKVRSTAVGAEVTVVGRVISTGVCSARTPSMICGWTLKLFRMARWRVT